MGPSGAGKTSLLNILTKRIRSKGNDIIKGQVLANRVQYDEFNFALFAAYVMQDDRLFETLTVKECIRFAANLRVIGTKEEKDRKLNEVLQLMRLTHCQNDLIGGHFIRGIPKGEKKRVSIA